jgi:hypothetical protein
MPVGAIREAPSTATGFGLGQMFPVGEAGQL